MPRPDDPAGARNRADRRGPARADAPSPLSPAEGAALERGLAAWRSGDPAGREAVCSLSFGVVREAAHLLLGRSLRVESDTGDVVGRVFCRFVRRPPPPDVTTAEELVRYLYRSVVNDLRDRHRARTRQKRNDRLKVELEASELGDWILHPRPSPSEIAMGRERFERYRSALAELDERHREAIILGCHLGCGSREAAEEMGFPTPGSYRAFLARSLARVSLAMGEG